MGNFKKGSLITGTTNNAHTLTSRNSLMAVISSNPFTVVIISSKHDDYIGTEWSNIDENLFEYTTLDAFFSRVTEAPRPTVQKLTAIRRKYGIEKFLTSEEDVVQAENAVKYDLTEEQRTGLREEIKTLLKQYRYHPTDAGVDKIIDEWARNKGWLIRLFEQHPNYNGKFQIVFDHDFDRNIDKQGSYDFARWLRQIKETILKEIVLDDVSYADAYKAYKRAKRIIDFFGSTSDIQTVNGENAAYWDAERLKYRRLKERYEYSSDIYCDDMHAYDVQSYNAKIKIDRLIDILECGTHVAQFVTSEAASYFNDYFRDLRIKEGQKLSRAVNKILCSLGVDKHPDYNKEFAKYADSISPLKIKRHTVLSIHPVDYYTMSFGNSWSSCQTIDRTNRRGMENGYHGMHSAGTESYMLDRTSMVFYTVDASYDGNELELQDKINRNMFHFDNDKLIQGRVYPQSNDSEGNDLYKDIREIVQMIVADLIKAPNLWVIKKGRSECSRVTTTYGRHYPDYLHFDNCNVSTLKDSQNGEKISIGHDPICPQCGRKHRGSDNIECSSCS